MKTIIFLALIIFGLCFALPDVTEKCRLCEWLVAYADAHLETETETQTYNELIELCSELQYSQSLECQEFINKHLHSIAVDLSNGKTQDEICGVHDLHYCLDSETHFSITSSPFKSIPESTPENPIELIETIYVNNTIGGTIKRLEVQLSIEHNSGADLTVSLRHNEKTVVLIERPRCSPSGNYLIVLSDVGKVSIQNVCPIIDEEKRHLEILPIEGVFSPKFNLNEFSGMSPSGSWELIITDTQMNEYQGYLNHWTLHFWGITFKSDKVSSQNTIAVGPGLSQTYVNHQDSFTIIAKDRYDNPIHPPNISFDIKIDCGIPSRVPNKVKLASCTATNHPEKSFVCSSGVTLHNWFKHTEIGGTSSTKGNDIWGWSDPLTKKEYAIIGQTTGTALVDVTNPSRSVYLGQVLLPPSVQPSSWRDIKTYKDHAFIISEARSSGMQVFDLTRLRSVTSPTNFVADVYFRGPNNELSNSHNININEETGYAYIVGATGNNCGGIYIVDIRNPKQPTKVVCHSPRYTHDTQCIIYNGPDTRYTGREICYCFDGGYGMTIKDVTNKANIVTLSHFSYSGLSYCHQGWLSIDRSFVLMNDELGPTGRTYVVNVTDLTKPACQNSQACYYDHGRDRASSAQHNNYVVGAYAYQANYRSGVRILNVANKNSPVEAGYLETSNYDPNSSGFNGQWSVYPFFPSKTIVANDIENGLFVLSFASASDLHLVTSDESLSVCGNHTEVSFNVDVISFNQGVFGPIKLYITGLPESVKVQFQNQEVLPNQGTRVTLTTKHVESGAYKFILSAYHPSVSAEKDMILNVFSSNPQISWTIAESEQGYNVQYQISDSGNFPIHVKVNGEPIFGSPFNIFVAQGYLSICSGLIRYFGFPIFAIIIAGILLVIIGILVLLKKVFK